MTLQAAALKREFPALPCLRMIHISCQHVEGEFLCIACWNSRYHEYRLQSTNSSNLWSSPRSMHIFISIMWSYLSCILDISIYSIWLQIIQLLSWFRNCSKFTWDKKLSTCTFELILTLSFMALSYCSWNLKYLSQVVFSLFIVIFWYKIFIFYT